MNLSPKRLKLIKIFFIISVLPHYHSRLKLNDTTLQLVVIIHLNFMVFGDLIEIPCRFISFQFDLDPD